MERPKYYLIFIFSVFLLYDAAASNKQNIYNAYLTNNMVQWKHTIDKMNKPNNRQVDFLIELVNYQYGYIAWCIGNKKDEEAKKYIQLAEQNIDILEAKNYNQSMINAYRSALYGFRIGLNILQAPFIGPKSIEYAELALKQDPGNWFAYLQKANIQYYKPSIFGGSKNDAINLYIKAKSIIEQDNNLCLQNWNYINLLLVIAQAYYETSDYQASEKYYKKILSVEPEFLWVRDELYPDLIKSVNE